MSQPSAAQRRKNIRKKGFPTPFSSRIPARGLRIFALGLIGLSLVALLFLVLSALFAKKPSIVWTAAKSQQELVLGPDSTVNFQFRLHKIDPATVQAIEGVLPIRPLDSSNTSFSLSYDELAPELQKDTTALVAVKGTGVVQKILFSGLAGNGKTYKTEVPVQILGKPKDDEPIKPGPPTGVDPPLPLCSVYTLAVNGSGKVNEPIQIEATPASNNCTPLSNTQIEWVINGSRQTVKKLSISYTPKVSGNVEVVLQNTLGKILSKKIIPVPKVEPEPPTPPGCIYALDIPKDKSLEIGRTYQYTAAQQNSGNCTEPDNAAFRWKVNNQFVAEGKVFRFSPNQSGTQTIELQLAGSRIDMQEVFVQYGIQYATQILDDYRKLLGDNPTDAEQNNFKAQIYAMAKSKNIYVVIDGVSKTLESYLRGVDGAIQAGYEDKIIQIYTDKSTGKIARLEIARSF